MWQLCGVSSRSASGQHRLTDEFFWADGVKKRRGGDAVVSRLPPASTMTSFSDEDIDSH